MSEIPVLIKAEHDTVDNLWFVQADDERERQKNGVQEVHLAAY
jgi:hypothetical protein